MNFFTQPACYGVIDCNNFFVSCERLFRPDLLQKPVMVLSSNDGCVVARSNEVRALGVKMGQPVFELKDLIRLHQITIFSANFSLYQNLSARVLQLIKAVCPQTEPYSIDEAFVELSTIPKIEREPLMQQLRLQIYQATQIPVSIGLAPTKTLAKLANELVKSVDRRESAIALNWPVIPQAGVLNLSQTSDLSFYLQTTPIEKIWGIGGRTAPKLTRLGINTAQDFIKTPLNQIQQLLKTPGSQIWHELNGIPKLTLSHHGPETQSLMVSRSFGQPITDFHNLQVAVGNFAEAIALKLRRQAQQTSSLTVSIFWKTRPGERYKPNTSANITLDQPSQLTSVIMTAAMTALKQAWLPDFPAIKAGINAFNLSPVSRQAQALFLDDQTHAQLEHQAKTWIQVDQLNQKFGQVIIKTGRCLTGKNHSTWQSKHQHRSPDYLTAWSDLAPVRCVT
ncbi:MAG TPA: hypothetical protein DEP87_04285 [Candidatus Pacebacteria bacterium]|nr:hypothetical protein [Candidatus Paceibacterota bacterium]